jgi:hypothetical protein
MIAALSSSSRNGEEQSFDNLTFDGEGKFEKLFEN